MIRHTKQCPGDAADTCDGSKQYSFFWSISNSAFPTSSHSTYIVNAQTSITRYGTVWDPPAKVRIEQSQRPALVANN